MRDITRPEVWAPDADMVEVVVDDTETIMARGDDGWWWSEPLPPGTLYQFRIDGGMLLPDPRSLSQPDGPHGPSRIVDPALFERPATFSTDLRGAVGYELHIGTFTPEGTFEAAITRLDHLVNLGVQAVEVMPVADFPGEQGWGYDGVGQYAVHAAYGGPEGFVAFIDACHARGLGVILDVVHNHQGPEGNYLAQFGPYFTSAHHTPWGDAINLDQPGSSEVRDFLLGACRQWLVKYQVDGLRVDAVASMLYLDYSRKEGQWHPNQFGGRENLEAISFLQEATATAYRKNPGTIMAAEESTAWPGVTAPTEYGGLGFGLKWNMGWMNDTLRYLAEEPINRRYHHGELTFSLVYAFSEQFILPMSHDEVVYGKGSLLSKMPGDPWQELAGLRALYAYQWSHPGKQLLFMGQEFGQGTEWNADTSLDWWILDDPGHQGLLALVSDLNHLYLSSPALWSEDFSHRGFEWIEAGDGDHNVLSYLRKGTDADGRADLMVCIINFAGTPHEGYRVGLPFAGDWEEVLNTDSEDYGGSGVGNLGRVEAEDLPWNGRPASVSLRVPPMGAVFLRPAQD